MKENAYTISVNADKRFYLDEESMDNGDSLVKTVWDFNQQKIYMYNRLF